LPHSFTQNAVLSLVAQQRTYGYWLRQEFEGWAIAGPMVPKARAIYDSLRELHAEGLIEPVDSAEPLARTGRDRRPYIATVAGEQRLTEWMESEPQSMDELWLRIGCARRQDIPALIRWVKKAEGVCLDRLQELGTPDLGELVATDAHWRLVTRALVQSVETSQVEERSRLLREIRRTLSQVARSEPPSP
jgi:DNA-binding PadR family transcriptional regulator